MRWWGGMITFSDSSSFICFNLLVSMNFLYEYRYHQLEKNLAGAPMECMLDV